MPAVPVEIVLLGTFVARVDGREVDLPVKKTRALLAWLAVEGRASRQRLAGVLWGDLDEPTARRNLRRAVHRLRSAGLGDAVVPGDEELALAGAVEVDARRFERLVDSGAFADALALCRGPFGDGLDVDDAPAFDAWLQPQRERHAARRRQAIASHAAALEAAGDLRGALAWRRRLCDDDPLQEAEWREVMRLHAALGERAEALAAFDTIAAALRADLGLEPLPQTRLLAERIRSREAAAAEADDVAAQRAHPAVPAPKIGTVPFVGRDAELQRLAMPGAALRLVSGEAGVGKSRLALEAAQRGALHPAAVVLVRCAEGSMTTPFHALVDALRSASARAALAVLPDVWKHDLAALLPELAPAAVPRSPEPALPDRDEARSRLLEALAQAFARVAGAGGAVVVDDLQWADASTVEAVAHLVRRHAQEPDALPRVVATARRHELGGNAFATVALHDLERELLLARTDLEPFDDWQMLQLVHALSRREGGVRFAARLVAATAGNVFFALETIRALLENGELRVDADRGWSTRFDDSTTGYAELPLPRSVIDAVRERVARIGAAAARLLETASLAGPGGTLAELRGATALSDWEALDAIEHAIDARVLERAGEGYRFAHDLIAQAVRHALSPERARLIHGRLAAALEPLGAATARVAEHWQEAGDAERAAAAWERAGDSALALHAEREGATHFERAGDLTTDDERAVLLYQRAVQSLFRVTVGGDDPAQLRLLARLEARGSPLARFSALLNGAHVASYGRRHGEALRLARAALAASLPGHPTLHLHALNIAAFSESHLGLLDAGYATYLEALAFARANDIVRGVPMMAASASDVALQRNRIDEAAPLVEEALRAGRLAMPDDIRLANVLSRTSRYCLVTGDRATGVRQLEEATAIAATVRAWGYLPVYLANLCEALVDDGRAGEAEDRHRELLTLPEEVKDGVFTYLAAFSRAAVDEQQGRLGAAITQARLAVRTADLLLDFDERRESRFVLARLLASVGAGEPALAVAEEAGALVPAHWPNVLLPLAIARAADRRASDPAAARGALVTALRTPFADRMLHPALDEACLELGRCHIALGDAPAARAAVQGLVTSVAAEAAALALRLSAAGADPEPADLAAAGDWLDGERVRPTVALELMRALQPHLPRRAQARGRERMRALAQRLADSLASEPALQGAFIRRHRDLLT